METEMRRVKRKFMVGDTLGKDGRLSARGRARRANPDCTAQLVERGEPRGFTLCCCEQPGAGVRDRLTLEDHTMSQSHHPTDVHLRQLRRKKRSKLRARLAAAPASAHAALEARLQRTYSAFHMRAEEKPPT